MLKPILEKLPVYTSYSTSMSVIHHLHRSVKGLKNVSNWNSHVGLSWESEIFYREALFLVIGKKWHKIESKVYSLVQSLQYLARNGDIVRYFFFTSYVAMEIDMCPNSGKVAQHIFESLRAVDNIYKFAWIPIKSTVDVSNIA